MKKIVALSGGKDSTAMALRLAETEPGDYEFCITPTGRELPVMEDHWKRLECLLGQELKRIPAPTLLELIIKQRALPNWRQRWCTRMVKIEPFINYAKEQAPVVCCVGIRADETNEDATEGRRGTDWNGIDGVEQDLPLVRWGWGISKVKQYLADNEIEVPVRTDCDMCFYQRVGEWWTLWRDHPDRWKEIEALETAIGHTLRSEGRDSWPASLKDLGEKFDQGLHPKNAPQQELDLGIEKREAMCAWCAR